MQNQIPKNDLYTPTFPPNWERSTLYGEAQWINGGAFRNSDFSDSGLPIIKIAEIKNGISDQTNYTSKKIDKNIFVKPGDILFSWSGTPETSIDIFFWKGFEGWLNQHTFKVEPKEGIDKKFFFYLLKYLKKVFVKIASNKMTTGLGHVTVNDLKNLIVGIPDKQYQKKIVSILSVFDDKIELNNKIEKTLEAVAKAIFKEWFLGAKGENLKLKSLFDVAEITYGYPFKSDLFSDDKNGTPVIRIRNLDGSATSTYTTEVADAKYKVKNGDILIGMDGEFYIRKWFGSEAYLNQRVVRLRPRGKMSWYNLFLSVVRPIRGLQLSISGTTVAHLSDKDLKAIKVRVIDSKNYEKVSAELDRLYWMLINLSLENRKLQETRDLILPKLMRGEIRV